MRVVTAKEGKTLRDFAKSVENNNLIAIFPEHGLSPNEQAAWLKENEGRFISVITFSPFIVSDAQDLHVMDSDVNIDMGSSVNKVTLVLWRSETIGDVAKDKLKQLRDKSEKANKEDLQAIIDEAYELGDSVERVLFIKTIMDKQ
jgi:hypothetical protein